MHAHTENIKENFHEESKNLKICQLFPLRVRIMSMCLTLKRIFWIFVEKTVKTGRFPNDKKLDFDYSSIVKRELIA